MSGEVPVWVSGTKKWVTGLNKKTTCDDVVRALLESEKRLRCDSEGNDVTNYVIIERWRKVERPLEPKTKLLKAWAAWGEEQMNVKLTLKATHRHRKQTESTSKSHRRKPQAKVKWRQLATIHPKKLQLLQEQDERKGTSETVERLMKVIIAQGETIQEQLRRLGSKEEQIESFEQRLHDNRVQTMGANYLLETYMVGQSTPKQEAEVHSAVEESKIRDMQHCIWYYERLLRLSEQLEREESMIQWLNLELESESQCVGVRTDNVEEARYKVERMSAINKRNLIELEENEMQLAKLSVWLEDKGCFVKHLECDLRQEDDEAGQLERDISTLSTITSTSSSHTLQTVDGHSKDSNPHLDTDSNSDTGLSSLHSSSDDVILDTLV